MRNKLFLILFFLLAACPALPGQETARRTRSLLGLPGKNWALSVDTTGFEFSVSRVRQDGGGRYVMATNAATGVNLSIWLEKAPQSGGSLQARDYYWNLEKKSKFKAEEVKMSELGQVAIVEYMVKSFEGMKVNQKNYHAYLAKDDYWVDMHLSKVNFQPGEEELFAPALKSLRIEENYTPSSFVYLEFGSNFYLQENYRKAIEFYAPALEMEKKQPVLDQTKWRVLVDNLGMAYGISGDLAKAKETFEYGLSRDATYPLFYYNLAATYAEMKDLDRAIEYLKKAFQYRSNMISGEEMPDPRKDSSFKPFLKDEKFRQALKEIGKSN